MKTLILLPMLVPILLLSVPASAQDRQVQASSQLVIQVEPVCQLLSNAGVASRLNFGEHSQLLHHAYAQTAMDASIRVLCSDSTTYNITINQGLHGDSTSTRRMQHSSGGEYLAYQLYQNVARTQVWDDTTGLSATGTGTMQQHVVYGVLLPQATPPAGVYHDQLIITVSW